MLSRTLMVRLGVAITFVAVGCQKETGTLLSDNTGQLNTTSTESVEMKAVKNATIPSGQVTVSLGGKSLTFWPYTANNFAATPQDPINLIFAGQCDPRQIRSALLSLSGDRTSSGFPAVAPFNAKWQDAIGDVQCAYGADEWTGGVIQLACGDYGPVRIHLRLFRMGEWTVGNAHFEVLIPGTADHQPLSWEIAEQLVIADFMRSGLLDQTEPLIPVGQINEASFRTIPAIIYNGLPIELKGLIGGPLGDVSVDVPIGSDGQALILNLFDSIPVTPDERHYNLTIDYGQVVPKPFCNDGDDYIYVQGPVTLEQTVTIDDSQRYEFTFSARGALDVTPVNPLTGQSIGKALTGQILEKHWGNMSDQNFAVSSSKQQMLLPARAQGAGSYSASIRISSDGNNAYGETIRCAADMFAGH